MRVAWSKYVCVSYFAQYEVSGYVRYEQTDALLYDMLLCEGVLFAEALHHCWRSLSFSRLPVTASHCRLEHGGMECL